MKQTRVIAPELLADLHRRLLAGEKWRDLAKLAGDGCSATGLKQCFRRAGLALDVSRQRRETYGQTKFRTREPVPLPRVEITRNMNLAAIRMLTTPLRREI